MKSVVQLWVACLKEAGGQYCVRTHSDMAYAMSRIEDEGIAFLTITLPTFEKDLLTAVSRGYVGSDLFKGFRWRGGLPAFLSGFLCHIFDADGSLREDVNIPVFRAVRQILLLVSKVELPTSEHREMEAVSAYVDTDVKLEEIPEDDLSVFRTVSRQLLARYLADVEHRLYVGDWIPRNSSGALATRESYNSRFCNRTWTERLQEVFPWWEDLAVNPHEIIDHMEDFSLLARDKEPPVRVALVPKTMKGPRIIAMEPAWMQFVQQGILRVMTEVLHQPKYRALARVFSWMDQEPNRLLAQEGSIDGSFATLDLSEASDRVSLQLVEALLSCTPFLRKCVMACRSERAELPTGEVINLNKFASMGSALCFPIESMVFFVIEAIAHAENAGIDPSALRVRDLPRMRVFGDDLIVPEVDAHLLTKRLETFGLKVNTRKSFTTGHFRESCGSDWFRGRDVSVFKLRAPFPSSTRQPELFDRAIQFHNNAYSAGWFLVAEAAEALLSRVTKWSIGSIPRVPVGVQVAALWTWDEPTAVRHHPSLQRIQYRSLVFRQNKPVDPLDGYGALRKVFSPRGEEPLEKGHLQRDGRSRYAGMHIGWTTAPY